MARKKSYILRARVSKPLKQAVNDYAADVDEAEAVVVREAVIEYLEKRGVDTGGKQPIGASRSLRR